MLQAREKGERIDEKAFAERVRSAVAECVAKQAEAGIDIVSDGELGKPAGASFIGTLAYCGPSNRRLA
jgi:5-methyltetrahydropteroyltriglutamate--homocysteine methyltransferase